MMVTLIGRQSYLACTGERDNNMEKLFYAVKAIGWELVAGIVRLTTVDSYG